MTPHHDRTPLWAAAARICAEAERGALAPGERAARLTAAPRLAGLTLEDILQAPAWFGEAADARARRVRLLGAAAVAATWRCAIDGQLLRRAAAAVGAEALEILTEQAPGEPCVRWAPAEQGSLTALDQLGDRVLAALLAGAPGLAATLGPDDISEAPRMGSGPARMAEALAAQLLGSRA